MKPEPFGFLPREVPAFPASPVLSDRLGRAGSSFFERLQLFIESKRKPVTVRRAEAVVAVKADRR